MVGIGVWSLGGFMRNWQFHQLFLGVTTMKSLFNAGRLGAVLFLLGAGLLVGPGLDPGQSAAAIQQTMYMEVGGHYCAGCCSEYNILCCTGTVCGET